MISRSTLSFNGQFGKIVFKTLESRICRCTQVYGYFFCFSIGVGCKIQHRRLSMLVRHIVHFFTNQTGSIETLCHGFFSTAVPINQVICGALVTLAPNIYVNNVLPVKMFIGHFSHRVRAILTEGNDIINIAAVCNEGIFFKSRTHKSFFEVCIQLHVCGRDNIRFDVIKYTNLCFTLSSSAVFLDELLEIFNRKINNVLQMVLYFVNFILNSANQLICLKGIKF